MNASKETALETRTAPPELVPAEQLPSLRGSDPGKQKARTPDRFVAEYSSPPCYLSELPDTEPEGQNTASLSSGGPDSIDRYRDSTLCLHAGTHPDPAFGGVCSPVYTSTAYSFPNPSDNPFYPRYFNTPNQEVVCRKLAALEKGEEALVFSSGMAAISSLLLANLNPGDHAVFQEDLYGGTRQLIRQDLLRLGVEITFCGVADDFAAALRPETKVIYLESPSNPLLHCVDLNSIARIGREKNILTIVDNTFATPINQNPLQLGIDVVVHSATKYLNGHSDVNAGFVVSSREFIHQLSKTAVNLGGMLDAQSCYQLERGLKTLALRIRQHNDNATCLAHYLQRHPQVARVNYPGLSDHPCHAIASDQMRGFGGMLSFELRESNCAQSLLRSLRVVTPALSLGGVESLICIPGLTSHRGMTSAERQQAGISDGLIRVSVGIEDIEDLLEDFQLALSTCNQSK